MVQLRLSRWKRRKTAVNRLKKHANARRDLRSAQNKLLNAEAELETMRAVNEKFELYIKYSMIALTVASKAAYRSADRGGGRSDKTTDSKYALKITPTVYAHPAIPEQGER